MVNRVKNDNDEGIFSKNMHLLFDLGREYQQAFIKFELNLLVPYRLPSAMHHSQQ